MSSRVDEDAIQYYFQQQSIPGFDASTRSGFTISPQQIAKSQRKLRVIIWDLDSTLVHSIPQVHPYTHSPISFHPIFVRVRNRIYWLDGMGVVGGCELVNENGEHFRYDGADDYWGIRRQYFKECLEACFELFDIVMVWTAGSFTYGHDIVRILFPKKPHIVWTYEMCDIDVNGRCVKSIQKALPEIQRALRMRGLDENVSIDQVVLIDDKTYSIGPFVTQLLHIKPFEPPSNCLFEEKAVVEKGGDTINDDDELPKDEFVLDISSRATRLALWTRNDDDVLEKLTELMRNLHSGGMLTAHNLISSAREMGLTQT